MTQTFDQDLIGTDGDDTQTAPQSGNYAIYGYGGSDTQTGGDGNDFLDGGTGDDLMSGGKGDDTYVVDSLDDVVVEGYRIEIVDIDGYYTESYVQNGIDTIVTALNYTLDDNVENLTLTGTDALTGTGNALDNLITGNSGDNSLFGGDGNDTLDGGAGNDTLTGGAGNDTYVVDRTSDVVIEDYRGGKDTVQSSVDYRLGETVENLTLTGSDALSGTGNDRDNVITGNSGDNSLYGGGANAMFPVPRFSKTISNPVESLTRH